jgi:hypothetical protein
MGAGYPRGLAVGIAALAVILLAIGRRLPFARSLDTSTGTDVAS